MYVHQVFLGINNTKLQQHPIFVQSSSIWKEFCLSNNYQYKLWSLKDVDDLLIENNLPTSFRYMWNKIDFCRYVILNQYGGLYVDLDIFPTNNFNKLLVNNDILINSWHNKKTNHMELNNALMKFKKNSLQSLIDYSLQQYDEKCKMKIYDKWKIRFFLQTTGNRMFQRWCKIHSLYQTKDIEKYITDNNTKSWLKSFC